MINKAHEVYHRVAGSKDEVIDTPRARPTIVRILFVIGVQDADHKVILRNCLKFLKISFKNYFETKRRNILLYTLLKTVFRSYHAPPMNTIACIYCTMNRVMTMTTGKAILLDIVI